MSTSSNLRTLVEAESEKREAAVLELWNRYGQSNGTQTWIEFQGDPHFIVNQVLAALDGVPEPEHNDSLNNCVRLLSEEGQ